MNTARAPLTVNTLNNYEKARLIRSTRKLEAMLGTTPHLTEAEPIYVTLPPMDCPPSPRTKASRRHGSIFTIFPIIPSSSDASLYSSPSTNSSVSSLTVLPASEPLPSAQVLPTPKSFSSSKSRRSAEPPRPLILRVNTVPVQSCDNRIPLSPMSPFITSTTTTPSPLLPDMPRKLSEAEVRRKRMAKLNRTFGENVPPEYVFPRHGQRKAAVADATSPPRQQPRNIPIPPSPVVRRSSQVWTTGSDTGAWRGEWNRKDIGEVQHKLRTLRVK
ncbi:hypothetical protein BC835DRAFT_1414147 [Cytidiella melzeri]|nr:hypothetical protein BC835DRAFT_1414147 [Cytidiella melzeri]